MKLSSKLLCASALCFAVVLSSCKEESTPTDPVEGTWSLLSMYVESQTEIPSRDLITDPSPCFYDGQGRSPRVTALNSLSLNSNMTGSLAWAIRCTDTEAFAFTYLVSGDNELTINQSSGESWVWNITSLTNELMEIEFERATDIELPTSGPAILHEDFTIKFQREE